MANGRHTYQPGLGLEGLGPAIPFSIAWSGLFAMATVWPQHLQAYFNRLCFFTIKCTETVSSCSRSSTPILLKKDPQCPQDFSCASKSWITSSRGKWAGKGLRPGCALRFFFSSSGTSGGWEDWTGVAVRLALAIITVFF